jgi:AcrR family transcriptional regulator
VALAAAMAEKGYVGTSVADVLKRSGVGRETFYQLFSSKLDCFMEAFDVAGQMLLGRLDEISRKAEGTPIERFERAVGEYFEILTEQPDFARVFLVEVYAAGPEALERRADLQERIVKRMAEVLEARTARERFACLLLVAAVGTLVTGPLVSHNTKAIRKLRDQVVDLVSAALEARG